eukprot:745686-Hanusia_phi.AAC.3
MEMVVSSRSLSSHRITDLVSMTCRRWWKPCIVVYASSAPHSLCHTIEECSSVSKSLRLSATLSDILFSPLDSDAMRGSNDSFVCTIECCRSVQADVNVTSRMLSSATTVTSMSSMASLAFRSHSMPSSRSAL